MNDYAWGKLDATPVVHLFKKRRNYFHSKCPTWTTPVEPRWFSDVEIVASEVRKCTYCLGTNQNADNLNPKIWQCPNCDAVNSLRHDLFCKNYAPSLKEYRVFVNGSTRVPLGPLERFFGYHDVALRLWVARIDLGRFEVAFTVNRDEAKLFKQGHARTDDFFSRNVDVFEFEYRDYCLGKNPNYDEMTAHWPIKNKRPRNYRV